jgi:tetratricopeptide (TPR) repeat protein
MLLEIQVLMQELKRKKDRQFIFNLRFLQAHGYSKCRLFSEALKVLGENTAAAKNLFLRSEEIYLQCFIVRVLYDAEMHQERLDHCLFFLENYPDVEIEHQLFIYNILGGCYKWLGDLQQSIFYFELSVEKSRDLSNKSFFIVTLRIYPTP